MDVSALPPASVSPTPPFSSNKERNAASPAEVNKTASGTNKADPQQQARVQELQKRDREVRAHEAAHVAAGGPYVRGGPSFQFTSGPDGKLYATGGEVSIDVSPVSGDPQATIQKMQTVERAAMAPAQPSSQDSAVAASASQEEAKARMEQMQSKLAAAGQGAPLPPGSLITDHA